MTKVFFDTEFTGLVQRTTLISIGLISESGETFYAEVEDYDKQLTNDWINQNVIDKLLLNNWSEDDYAPYSDNITVRCLFAHLWQPLSHWLHQFESVEIWSDCMAYDWVLFCQIFGGAFEIPKNIYYIPFDLSTLFKAKGVDPDIQREKFAYGEYLSEMKDQKHNALWDAKIIKTCYEKLMQ